ncbi:hypothetical protein vseg_016991 [Gypsophila vaccaria]
MADYDYDEDDYIDDNNYDDDEDFDDYYGDDVENDPLEDDNLVVDGSYYTVLQEAEIRRRQEQDISHVSSTLFISIGAASRLLYHYKWNISILLDRWFVDEVKIRDEVGLSNTDGPLFRATKEETLCGICFESFPLDDFNFYPSDCGHYYCVTCWNGYITSSIDDGPGCLSLRCPYPKCNASICRDMIDKLVGDVEKEKYYRFFVRSYVEENKKAKWCPAPGCENAVEFEIGNNVYDVTCSCTHSFCWNCVEEVHRPVDCKTVSEWILKNTSESENTTWILANSKPCPKCSRAIEKNHGCMHMTCGAPCFYEFCWLCLGDWKKHGERTGGFFACNRYEAEKINGVHDADELKRRLAKKHLEKYTHYYERWVSNDKSRKKAVEEVEKLKLENLAKLSTIWDKPETELVFILRAWEQIIECRGVLKWTYAYAYYLPDEQTRKKKFFEYLQGEAESNLERLHKCVEKEMTSFFEPHEVDSLASVTSYFSPESEPKTLTEEVKAERATKLRDYQYKLISLTKVTQSFFDKLVRDLEKGLSEFDMDEDEVVKCRASSIVKDSGGGLNDYDHWSCSACTFANPNNVRVCGMCNARSPRVLRI